MDKPARIAPSILAADLANLASDVEIVAPHVDLLHVDVMDGHFVPNISLGPPVISSLRKATDLYLDCHLMISDPLTYLEAMKDSGADGVTVHIEAVPNPEPVATEAERLGLDFGLVLNPPTPVSAVTPYLHLVSTVLVMSVHPGFGGQTFIGDALGKIERLREIIDSESLSTDIEVDGGIDLMTAGPARAAGANVFVAGTYVFGAEDPVVALGKMQKILDEI